MDHHGSPTPPLSGGSHGRKVEVNGKELALFCHREKLYAVGDRCPHMGACVYIERIYAEVRTIPVYRLYMLTNLQLYIDANCTH